MQENPQMLNCLFKVMLHFTKTVYNVVLLLFYKSLPNVTVPALCCDLKTVCLNVFHLKCDIKHSVFMSNRVIYYLDQLYAML